MIDNFFIKNVIRFIKKGLHYPRYCVTTYRKPFDQLDLNLYHVPNKRHVGICVRRLQINGHLILIGSRQYINFSFLFESKKLM